MCLSHEEENVRKRTQLDSQGDDLSTVTQPLTFEEVLARFHKGTPKEHVGEGNLSHSGHLVKAGVIEIGKYKRQRTTFYHDQAGVYCRSRGRPHSTCTLAATEKLREEMLTSNIFMEHTSIHCMTRKVRLRSQINP